jgi:hypothetical protein
VCDFLPWTRVRAPGRALAYFIDTYGRGLDMRFASTLAIPIISVSLDFRGNAESETNARRFRASRSSRIDTMTITTTRRRPTWSVCKKERGPEASAIMVGNGCGVRLMKRSQKIQICVLAAITCVACTKMVTPLVGTQEERATVDQEVSETAQICQVHYRSVDRDAQCTEVGSVMLSELHIPTRTRVEVRPSCTANYEQVGRMLQSLQNSGYASIEFPSH